MMPYLAWLGLASSINAYVWYYNREPAAAKIEELTEEEKKKE